MGIGMNGKRAATWPLIRTRGAFPYLCSQRRLEEQHKELELIKKQQDLLQEGMTMDLTWQSPPTSLLSSWVKDGCR